jgi:hypothetical protein
MATLKIASRVAKNNSRLFSLHAAMSPPDGETRHFWPLIGLEVNVATAGHRLGSLDS